MANSLMELYGGGMTGRPTNYQLGGRIARSNLERAVQTEQRELQRKQQEAARKKSRAQGLGTILGGLGSFAGSFIPIPGLGTALGSAIGSGLGAGLGQLLGESTFKGTDVGEGRFLQQGREDLQDSIDDFKSSLGERALATGVSRFATSAASNLPGIRDELGIGTKARAKAIRDQALRDNPFLQTEESLEDFLPLDEVARPDIPIEMQDFSDELTSQTGSFILPEAEQFTQLSPEQFVNRRRIQRQLENLSSNQGISEAMQFNPFQDMSAEDLSDLDFNFQGVPDFVGPLLPGGLDYNFEGIPDFTGPMLPQMRGGGLLDMMLPKMQMGGLTPFGSLEDLNNPEQLQFGFNPNAPTPPPPPPPPTTGAPYTPGYGTATTITGALGQLGMQDIANDPRLQEYMSELPQFGMGYTQQLGDIQLGAQQSARDIRQQSRQAAGQRGFSGSGIGQSQLSRTFGDLTSDVARQRRGVVESFQADLLGAIRDIERAGEFEFGTENYEEEQRRKEAEENIRGRVKSLFG